ncbi:MAG: hypothetical protein H8E74_07645 [Gammaproteobacteria bacterium]|nr:hypothetical protein [Gammaproteobacteria bacterium]
MSSNNSEDLNEPAPIKFVLDVAQAMETRIDYNFNSIIQVSLLVEFLYEALEKQGIEIPLDESFEKFQAERLSEIKAKFDEAVSEATEEVAKEAMQEQVDETKINLEDS